MKSYILLLFTLLFNYALATYYSYSSTFYGCPDECETQEDPKCERGIPKNNLFIALVIIIFNYIYIHLITIEK